ncbi:MAG: methyltransferase regulatory domain-containing protein [Chloroflexi bacterium]|nr:methyltransferase regulatory domain-containing protein [Chloroflexota bacterium]
MTQSTIAASYDAIPYPNLGYSHTHPDHLATLATLLGLNPASPEKCRVLELGTASGWNIIPFAYAFPESQFVGIDISPIQIQEGLAGIEALGLKNVRLEARDILDITPEFGEFDYIIAHGVYSWVPPEVRDAVMRVCKQNLALNGVAYISYNTYPGSYMTRMVREMMLYHTRNTTTPFEQAESARDFMAFLRENNTIPDSGFAAFLNTYSDMLQQRLEHATSRSNSVILHDELAEINDALYFHEFASHAAQHGLQYLVEAEFPTVMVNNLKDPVIENLKGFAGDIIETEQYLDFLRNRNFRKTLLCHAEIELERTIKLERVTTFRVSSMAHPVNQELDIATVSPEKFAASDKANFTTDHPLSKAAFFYLSEVSPQSIPFRSLFIAARNILAEFEPQPDDAASINREAQILAANLLQAYSYSTNLIAFSLVAPRYLTELSEYPTISPIARYMARSSLLVPNMRHERVELDAISHFLLLKLDGTNNRTDLMNALLDLFAKGSFGFHINNEPVTDPDKVKEILENQLELTMEWFTHAALLIA